MSAPSGENGHASQSGIGNGATEDATAELSRLMLEGWTMMAETCPRADCYIPLARSREGQLYCCACRSNVSALDSPIDAASASTTSTPAQPSQDPPADESNAPPDTEDGSNSVVAIRGGAGTGLELAVSTALGEKLLQGWTLLNNTCQVCNTPLLRGQSGTLLCVQCATDGVAAAASTGAAASTHALPASRTRPSLPPPRENRTESIMPAPAGPSNHERHHDSDSARRSTTTNTTDDATYIELLRSEEAVVDSMRRLRTILTVRRDLEGMDISIRALGEGARTIESLRLTRARIGDLV